MQNAAALFQTKGTPVLTERYGSGHINETYLVRTDQGARYILQKINRHVFTNVEALMENIAAVTRYLARKDPDPNHVLTLVPALGGADWQQDENGDCWRMYVFIDGLSLDRARTPEEFRQSGVAFGRFQRQLADFPVDALYETIPRFHDTPARYAQLRAALEDDEKARAAQVRWELDFYLAREEEAGRMVRMTREKRLPQRVTHNDTKLNNVLLDRQTGAPLCVIDLDTVMPGLAGNDFGDSIRFGASTAGEDEKNLDRVSLSLPLYEAYAQGFLAACGDSLTPLEIETLPLGAKLMTLECGARFLTDYLRGDVYFHIARPEHNLDRCRTQARLVLDMEQKWDSMRKIVRDAQR